MELDFDKEINALLRRAAKDSGRRSAVDRQNDGNPQSAIRNPQSHLDADEISAFAENALPEKTRNFYIKHFAECDRCRMILSNTILLNAEAEIKTASSAVAAPISEIAAAKIPWYRKMFLMPNLAYTMGGLVLVFGGMLGFLVLQNVDKSSVSDVSQIQEKSPAYSGGPNGSDDGISYNSNAASNSNAAASSANAMASNSAMANNSATATNSASNAAASATNSMASNSSIFSPDKPSVQSSVPAEMQKQSAAKPTDDMILDERNEAELRDRNKDAEARKDEAAQSATDSATPPPAAPPPPPPSVTMRRAENSPPAASEKKNKNALPGTTNNTRQIGGKIFNRVGGVWIDSVYNKYGGGSTNTALPSTKTIRRGSSKYQKLDKQVRIIAESLDGAVIIVWRDGAYRIQ